MSEQRFRANFDVSIYDSETEEYISASENGLKEIAQIMNEQQSTINKLTESKDKWKELATLHNAYFNCLEKAIEKAYEEKPYPKIEDIMDIYSELEKEIEE